jgi:hypothetical protein
VKENHRMMKLNELLGGMIVDDAHERDSLDHKCTCKRAIDSNTALKSHVFDTESSICVTSRMKGWLRGKYF